MSGRRVRLARPATELFAGDGVRAGTVQAIGRGGDGRSRGRYGIAVRLRRAEFCIRKAIGRTLREYAKSNPDEVVRYVKASAA